MIDVSRFHETFFEESMEGLDVMERGLLGLEAEAGREAIDEIFRAAHSIKGGSGTFGFQEITRLTHFLETLLDQMRTGERQPDAAATRTLLDSVDCLRQMLAARRGGPPVEEARVAALAARLEAHLSLAAVPGPAASGRVAAEPGLPAAGLASVWLISFRPHPGLLRTGNDPLWILKELAGLGPLEVRACADRVPALLDLEPGDCYLTWTMELTAEVEEIQIRSVFDWVETDCELEIKRQPSEAPTARALAEVARPEGPPPESAAAAAEAGRRPPAEGSSLRVSTGKVDAIINLVGELVITQSMLSSFSDHFEMSMLDRLRDGLSLLARNTRELQETVLKIRMLPVSFCFNRFPRLVHDLSSALGKQVQIKMTGEATELDKTVLERITDPLVHLVRNALDHGIETPEARRAAGKPEQGTLRLHAAHEGGSVTIEIADDGAGLNTARILEKARRQGLVPPGETPTEEKIHELIFAPGFSTAEQVTDISGRGVGMDVVRRNIKELGGSIEIQSRQQRGTRFLIRLPLTLAILDGQLVRVGDQTYVIPLLSIVESLQIKKQFVHAMVGGWELYRLREEYLPVLRLERLLGGGQAGPALDGALLVVIEADGRRAGLLVDDLLAQQQVVIKSLESNFRRVDGVSGATILGDGTVAMILDVAGIAAMCLAAPRAA